MCLTSEFLSPRKPRGSILCADSKAKGGIEREVFVCNFAQLQFPVGKRLRASVHSPVK